MRRTIRAQLVLLLGCLAANGLAYWATTGYPERVEAARQTPPPAGMAYLDACDGRPTDTLALSEARDDCVADYPGEFGRGVVMGLSVALFVLGNLLYMTLAVWRASRRRAGGVV